jgi:hypothetical protein
MYLSHDRSHFGLRYKSGPCFTAGLLLCITQCHVVGHDGAHYHDDTDPLQATATCRAQDALNIMMTSIRCDATTFRAQDALTIMMALIHCDATTFGAQAHYHDDTDPSRPAATFGAHD